MRIAAVVGALLAASCTHSGMHPSTARTVVGFPVGTTWEWVGTVTAVERVVSAAPARYNLRVEGGQASMRADCNRGVTKVTLTDPGRIAFGSMAWTRAMCPGGSQSGRYAKEVARATSYFVKDGELYLELPVDSGTLRFRRAKAH